MLLTFLTPAPTAIAEMQKNQKENKKTNVPLSMPMIFTIWPS